MVVEDVKIDCSEISWEEPRNEVCAGAEAAGADTDGADTVRADTVWADTVGINSSEADSAGGGIAEESSG